MSKTGVKRSFVLLLSLWAAGLVFASPADAQNLSKGWWVIVASMPATDTRRMGADAQHFTAAAARCGFTTFNDFSNKFRGFQPGYNVFVIGAFPSQPAARQALSQLQPCLPGSYIKFGEYLGE